MLDKPCQATFILSREYKGLVENDIYNWRIALTGPINTPYEGGILFGYLKFPKDFPNYPPEMFFNPPIFHPNIYPDGKVCMSILHSPGVDITNENEDSACRWRPIISVESILLSVICLLGEPNLDSPANVDAAVSLRY